MGSTIKIDSPKFSLSSDLSPGVFGCSNNQPTINFISTAPHFLIQQENGSGKVGTGKYPSFLVSRTQHSRVRRGREIYESHQPFGMNEFSHSPKKKTSPQVNSELKK